MLFPDAVTEYRPGEQAVAPQRPAGLPDRAAGASGTDRNARVTARAAGGIR